LLDVYMVVSSSNGSDDTRLARDVKTFFKKITSRLNPDTPKG